MPWPWTGFRGYGLNKHVGQMHAEPEPKMSGKFVRFISCIDNAHRTSGPTNRSSAWPSSEAFMIRSTIPDIKDQLPWVKKTELHLLESFILCSVIIR
jgi:hypothetical protein